MSAETNFRRAAARYRKLEGELDDARDRLYQAAVEARAEGMKLEAMAHVLGVTRQRVAQLLKSR